MTPSIPLKKAIGYLRVSTEKQGKSGVGLDGQRIAIDAAAKGWGYHIVEWYQDVHTGRHYDSLNLRNGVQAAISHASTLNLPIFVDGLDRFSRHSETIEQIVAERKLHIISAKDGSLIDPVILSSRAARAEHDGDLISQRTKQALDELKRQGVKLGNTTNLHEAQKKGAAGNKTRSENKANEIADLIRSQGNITSLTKQEIVDLLNGQGLTTGSGKQWTYAAVRRQLKMALYLIESEDQDHADYKDQPDFGRF
tara:strand:+ start:151 stop:909 length:759 start_codon:yes stop_codon:yes gene_type:complete